MLREIKEEKKTPPHSSTRLCLDGVLSLGEVNLLLLLLLGDERSLVLGQTAADGAGLLGAEVQRSVPKIMLDEFSRSAWCTHFLPL